MTEADARERAASRAAAGARRRLGSPSGHVGPSELPERASTAAPPFQLHVVESAGTAWHGELAEPTALGGSLPLGVEEGEL